MELARGKNSKALSASVSKLQPSEMCVTSILTSPGHSRSKPMAAFSKLQPSVWKIQPFENT